MCLPSISLATAFYLAATCSAAPLVTPVPTRYGVGQNAIVRALPYYDTKPPLLMVKRSPESDQEDVNVVRDEPLSARRNIFDWAASLDLASTPSPASSTGVSSDSGSPSISSTSALISARRSTPEMEDPVPVPPPEHILLEPKEYLQPSSTSISSEMSSLISACEARPTSTRHCDGCIEDWSYMTRMLLDLQCNKLATTTSAPSCTPSSFSATTSMLAFISSRLSLWDKLEPTSTWHCDGCIKEYPDETRALPDRQSELATITSTPSSTPTSAFTNELMEPVDSIHDIGDKQNPEKGLCDRYPNYCDGIEKRFASSTDTTTTTTATTTISSTSFSTPTPTNTCTSTPLCKINDHPYNYFHIMKISKLLDDWRAWNTEGDEKKEKEDKKHCGGCIESMKTTEMTHCEDCRIGTGKGDEKR
ncbi:hypothetical protein BDV97DRAFT_362426 [Delphinella strobiligena]|nr:hypothetical protein BDV97DRAFT_362426 [Delphinella strobiligena]